jgi:sigma-B regulation protein RsbU (phosphoserine phosphatase)
LRNTFEGSSVRLKLVISPSVSGASKGHAALPTHCLIPVLPLFFLLPHGCGAATVKARVLVIDQPEDERAWLEATLQNDGFQVCCAASSAAGLSELARCSADLVLCDLGLTDEHGEGLLTRLRRERPELPVVVLTGDAQDSTLGRAMGQGAADFLARPLGDAAGVHHAVSCALERFRLRDENERVKGELETANAELRRALEALHRDQAAGRQLQEGMLPETPTAIGGVTFAHKILPSLYLSGDYVDYFPITDQHVLFYLADVSGHGAPSAFVTVLLKQFSNRLRREYRPHMLEHPDDILSWLNQELLDSHLQRHVTLFLGIIDFGQGVLRCANAGHFPEPRLVTEAGVERLSLKGKPLGLFEAPSFQVLEKTLPEAFSLALFSDGVLDVLSEATLAGKDDQLDALAAAAQGQLPTLWSLLAPEGADALPDDVACLLLSQGAAGPDAQEHS